MLYNLENSTYFIRAFYLHSMYTNIAKMPNCRNSIADVNYLVIQYNEHI
jgi:hypothetical protein